MVRFIIKRPVAVIMTFLAVVLLGLVASGRIPVSLMPDIDIPEITVAVSRPDVSSREVENTIVSILRRSLMQVPGVEKMSTESRNGSALIRLTFAFGNNINLAFMEVNEKIDGAMDQLPGDLERPRVIKASASDIPVFFLNIASSDTITGKEGFASVSDFAQSIIRKRIEQLPEVALADMTGQTSREIFIRPDQQKMRSLGISDNDISSAIAANNVSIGSILVKEGKYLYNLEFNSNLTGVGDVENIFLKSGGRLFRMGDVAEVGIREQKPTGVYLFDGKQSVALAIIKDSNARMAALEKKMTELVGQLKKDYPRMTFNVSQDQTRLLDYSLQNLRQSLWCGGLLAFFIMFFFLKDAKSPMIIGVSIPVTLVISLLFFYIVGLSMNVISLAGLILGIGMMIDNSIVVTENIMQWTEKGEPLLEACVKGTNEVIAPLITSVLTTCATFIPLIFLSGISGALFYDQAIAIVIGQGVSLIVGIGLLPTIHYLLYKRNKEGRFTRLVQKVNLKHIEDSYEGMMSFFFRHGRATMITFAGIIAFMFFMFLVLKKEKFPAVRQDELVASVEWNENIDLNENVRRSDEIISGAGDLVLQSNTFVGEQKFLFIRDYDQSYTSVKIYIKTGGYKEREKVESLLGSYIEQNYPAATLIIGAQENIFEKIFSASEAPLVAEVSLAKEGEVPPVDRMMRAVENLQKHFPDAGIMPPPLEEKIMVRLIPEKLMLYDVDASTVYSRIKSSLNQDEIGELRSSNEILPIMLTGKDEPVSEYLSSGFVTNRDSVQVPLSEITDVQRIQYYKSIMGGMTSEFVPLAMNVSTNKPAALTKEVRNVLSADAGLDVTFSGGLITGQQLFKELSVILAIAVLLLYFILAAQFESLAQPVIVLLEIPIDIAGALLLIWLWGGSINVMTMIGLIVMSGVIINDSILKVDTINNLRAEGMELKEAIYTGGSRRLKPIIMVAMASIFSTLPMLFGGGIGAELQRPMALSLLGGMTLGTVVSLFFIPLTYWYIYRKSKVES
jgi:multidrug efflux pump subunit AcrB